jgi:hypothetical protein
MEAEAATTALSPLTAPPALASAAAAAAPAPAAAPAAEAPAASSPAVDALAAAAAAAAASATSGAPSVGSPASAPAPLPLMPILRGRVAAAEDSHDVSKQLMVWSGQWQISEADQVRRVSRWRAPVRPRARPPPPLLPSTRPLPRASGPAR